VKPFQDDFRPGYMKHFLLIVLIITIVLPPGLCAGLNDLAEQVQISLIPPSQPAPDLPPQQLNLRMRSPFPLYYKLETTGMTIASGRLIKGDLTVGLSWREMERIGRVPLTLSVMDQGKISRRELCMIFSTLPVRIAEDGKVPAAEVTAASVQEKPQMEIVTQSENEFKQVLRDIRATPAPERPYEMVDPKVFARVSISPVNLLLFAAVKIAQKIMKKKQKPLEEISCSYCKRQETGQEWVTIRVNIINRVLPERL